MADSVVPDVRPGLSVLLRALVGGAAVGTITALALALVDPGPELLLGLLLYGACLGPLIAALSAGGWLLTVGHGPRWAAEVVAGLVTALPFVLLATVFPVDVLGIAAVAAALVAASIARWQGYERHQPVGWIRPTSSRRVG